jgi:hypothetical protein
MESGCNSTLAAVAGVFHLDMVVCIHGDVCIVGLSDGEALVHRLAIIANLLANTGANICLDIIESFFVDIHDIGPTPVEVATTPKNAIQITYCRWMGYLRQYSVRMDQFICKPGIYIPMLWDACCHQKASCHLLQTSRVGTRKDLETV